MTAYAAPSDLLARYDARTIGNLVSDSGSTVSSSSLLTDPNVAAALASASGLLQAALLQGERYSIEDLTSLTDNSQAYLVQLCCEIAFAKLYERRPWSDSKQRGEAIQRANDALELLRTGKHIFALQTDEGAGVPNITGATTPQRRELNLICDRATPYFYPRLVQPGNR
ncbi:MAG: DUF1320 family protein [Patescibacteria group bacterium]|nr:DUF1320 family protein [Patescibacteria group bacterium]